MILLNSSKIVSAEIPNIKCITNKENSPNIHKLSMIHYSLKFFYDIHGWTLLDTVQRLIQREREREGEGAGII